jgi:hypothetical protein
VRAHPNIGRALRMSAGVGGLFVVAFLFLGSPRISADDGIQGAEAIAILNQQRQANGIPPVPNVNQNYAASWCPEEGTGPTGGETWTDVSTGENWGQDETPWTDAPLHQLTMYDPAMDTAGDVDVDGNACMGLGGDANQPTSGVTFYAFIWEGGPRNVPTSETVYSEEPFAPGQVVGIPDGQATGPQPLLYPEGLGETPQAVSWTLTEANGTAVPNVQFVDDAKAVAAGYPSWAFSPGGVMIPPVLEPGTTYDGTVVWRGPGDGTSTQTFSFTTATAPATNNISVQATPEGRSAKLTVRSSAPTPTLTLTGPRISTPTLTSSGQTTVALAPGSWRACASSGGATTDYQQAQECTEFTITPSPVVKKDVVRSAS